MEVSTFQIQGCVAEAESDMGIEARYPWPINSLSMNVADTENRRANCVGGELTP